MKPQTIWKTDSSDWYENKLFNNVHVYEVHEKIKITLQLKYYFFSMYGL